MGCNPLTWPVDINSMSDFKRRFNLNTPFIGYAVRIRRGVNCQLKQRKTSDLSEWDKYPHLKIIAKKTSHAFYKYLKWSNDLFLPEDPFDIIDFDYLDGLGSADARAYIETEFDLPDEFDFQQFADEHAKFIKVIQAIYDQIEKKDDTNNEIV